MKKFNLPVLLFLSCGHMVTDIYQGALPAILPFLKQNLQLSYTVAGIILIVANVSSSIVQPLFGFISDKKTKAFLLPLGVLLAAAGFALIPTTRSFVAILLLVGVSGLGVAAFHPEGYKTARHFTGPKMATGMAIFSVGGNAGMAIGPILALAIIDYAGFDALPWISIPALAFVAAVVPLRRTIAIPEGSQQASAGSRAEAPAGAHRALTVLICAVVMRTWIQLGLMTYIPFYYIDVLQGDPVFAGKIVSSFLLGGAFGTLAGAPLADRWGHLLWLRFSMIACALLFPLVFFTTGYLLFAVMTLLGTILISTFSVTVVMGQNLMPRNLGIASGLLTGFAIGAGGIGVTLFGVIADHFGVYSALKCIGILPPAGFLFTLMLKHPALQTADLQPPAEGKAA